MGYMSKKKVHRLFRGVPNVCSITDDILTTDFGELGRDHDTTSDKVLTTCRQGNLKLNKGKCHKMHPGFLLFVKKYSRVSDWTPGICKH